MSRELIIQAFVITTIIYLQISSYLKIKRQAETIEHYKLLSNCYRLLAKRRRKR
jgi:hypothetical protein